MVPCFNEENMISHTCERLFAKLRTMIESRIIAPQSGIVFVDDGSSDNTWQVMKHLAQDSSAQYSTLCPPPVKLKASPDSFSLVFLKLSRNFGHQNALLAGLEYVADKCDCAISIDCDLQQDENVFDEFIAKYQAGSDIVLGIRKSRSTDSVFKKYSAMVFYDFMKLMGTQVVKNHADYRLLSAKALKLLCRYKESNLFLRGVIMDMGLKHDRVYFDVKPRDVGLSKYTLRKMFAFALEGITSFSVAPLRLVSIMGVIFFLLAFVFLCYVLYVKFWTDNAIFGWASTAILLCFFSGIQLLSLGIIGEYVGKIYTESKRRPRYVIEDMMSYGQAQDI